MKPTFSQLKPEERASFGNGCSYVPDLVFTDICREHDFGYTRGGNLLDKAQDDVTMLFKGIKRSKNQGWYWFNYTIVAIVYYLGCTFLPIAYFKFNWGDYKTLEEILKEDLSSPGKSDINPN